MIRIIIFSLLFFTSVYSQKITQNNANWFAYIGQYNVSKKWGYHVEAQFRLDEALKKNNQNLFRLGVFYNKNANLNFALGYGIINTLNPGANHYFNEDRVWEQIQLSTKWNQNKNLVVNRFRFEQRFVDKIGLVDEVVTKLETNYQNRFRYLNRNLFHLLDFKSGNEKLYFVLQDEIFMNIGRNKVNSNFFDQNRFLLGLGVNYKNSIRFELGYMNHLINPNQGNNIMNHTVSLALFHNLIHYKE